MANHGLGIGDELKGVRCPLDSAACAVAVGRLQASWLDEGVSRTKDVAITRICKQQKSFLVRAGTRKLPTLALGLGRNARLFTRLDIILVPAV